MVEDEYQTREVMAGSERLYAASKEGPRSPQGQKDDQTDDPSKGTYALEIYALEIQMYAETRNNKRLKVSGLAICTCDSLNNYRPFTSVH